MDDRQINTFILVSELGSFSACEQVAFISKQAIIKQMNALETELGFKLFNRRHNGVQLTPQGQIFYKGIKRINKEKQELLLTCMKQTNTNIIRIGSTDHQTFLDPVNKEFNKQFPDIELKRIIHPNHSGEWRVENNIQDVAETYDLQVNQFENAIFVPLQERYYKLLCHPTHPLIINNQINMNEISQYKTLIFPLMFNQHVLDEIRELYNNNPDNLIESDDVDNQLPITYQCIKDNILLISANPFVDHLTNVNQYLLKENWKITCGLIYHPPLTMLIDQYISIAKQVYNKKP